MMHNRTSKAIGLFLAAAMLISNLVPGAVVSAETAGDSTAHESIERAYSKLPESRPILSEHTWPQSVQPVTEDPGKDTNPSILYTPDGKLRVAWESDRTGCGEIWYKDSADNGTSWSEPVQITWTDRTWESDPVLFMASDGTLWLAWIFWNGETNDIWYTTSDDNGVTWAENTRLEIGTEVFSSPSFTQTSDGTIFVFWQSFYSENMDIWFTTTSDNGLTWSEAVNITKTYAFEKDPAAMTASDGTIWLTWGGQHDDALYNSNIYYVTSSDKGATWSASTRITTADREDNDPAITQTEDGRIWIVWDAWYPDNTDINDIWYSTTTDNGQTWETPVQFTFFDGNDACPSITPVDDNHIAIAWETKRTDNNDIWFGIPGVMDDTAPVPNVTKLWHDPMPNPDCDEIVTVFTEISDETGIAQVELVWDMDSVEQTPVMMYNDGTNGDEIAGDKIWSANLGPFPSGTQVSYLVRVTDSSDISTIIPAAPVSFTSQDVWTASENILYVMDSFTGPNWEYYYLTALEEAGVAYDHWYTHVRGMPDATELGQYTDGMVIWGCAASGYHYLIEATGRDLPGYNPVYDRQPGLSAVMDYLDSGGDMFILGRNIGWHLDGTEFYTDYLHAVYEGFTDYQWVNGIPDDPVTDGLSIEFYWGGGEAISVTAPAVPILHYSTSGEPLPSEFGPVLNDATTETTAGLRIDTGTYKLVYLPFDFQDIQDLGQRTTLLERALTWLGEYPEIDAPLDGDVFEPGEITFTWQAKEGVTGYRIQIDTTPDFNSPGLIELETSGLSYTADITTPGKYYWRMKTIFADHEGIYTSPRQFKAVYEAINIAGENARIPHEPDIFRTQDGTLRVIYSASTIETPTNDIWTRTSNDEGNTWSEPVRITTGTDQEHDATLTQTNDGKLWLVFTLDGSGYADIWYKTSTDNGETWSEDIRLTTYEEMDAYPGVIPVSDTDVLVTWVSYRDGDRAIFGKTSSNSGQSWTEAFHVTDIHYGINSDLARTPDGIIWLVYEVSGHIEYQTSTDNGKTWGQSVIIPTNVYSYDPGITVDTNGVIYISWTKQETVSGISIGEIWYLSTANNGVTWSDPVQFTTFQGNDSNSAITTLADTTPVFVWTSDRVYPNAIMLGIPGHFEDVNPPPYPIRYWPDPYPYPDSDEIITITAEVLDDKGVADVQVVWRTTYQQVYLEHEKLPMYNDGTHGDLIAGDAFWTTQLGPFSAGYTICYEIEATDIDGNTILVNHGINQCFEIVEPFVPENDILLVADSLSDATAQEYVTCFSQALDTAGISFDVWDVSKRGGPDITELRAYNDGAVIWATNRYYISSLMKSHNDLTSTEVKQTRNTLMAWLDEGGKLFLSGNGILLNGIDPLFNDYLYSEDISDTPYTIVTGKPGDPVGGSLDMELLVPGQRIIPTSPAASVFTYGTAEDTAGVRVETGTYKAVYCAFGIPDIIDPADRADLMRNTVSWLTGQQFLRQGDVNGDTMINVFDITQLAGMIIGTIPENDQADVNGDGTVNILDITLIARIILGLE